MSKLDEAKEILFSIGMPKKQRNDRSAYVLLALLGLKEDMLWSDVSNESLRIVDMMNFMAENYNKIYKPNTRETIRKDTIHQFCDGAISERNVGSSGRATNSPQYSYRVTMEALELFKSFGSDEWNKKLNKFIESKGTLEEKYAQKRELVKIPIMVNGVELTFSPGAHNQLQKAIIEEFAPRFAQNSIVLYVGDTENKYLVKNNEKLRELGVNITDHDKLPDVVLYREDKNWIYFIEAVTSVGPISVKRVGEIEDLFKNCTCGKVYVTAFLDMTSKNGFKKFINDIAWETEIWVADQPDHMIHLNGDRFLGPR